MKRAVPILLLPSLKARFLLDQIEQVGRLFFDIGIELLAAEGLVNGAEGALESLSRLHAAGPGAPLPLELPRSPR